MHTIETARTNDPQYNRINIEFIYGSIDLELRSQAEGHIPSKIELINLTTPEAYLQTLEKLYTPADHLSTKRSEFEGWRQLPMESPIAYLADNVLTVHQSQVQRSSLLSREVLDRIVERSIEVADHHASQDGSRL